MIKLDHGDLAMLLVIGSALGYVSNETFQYANLVPTRDEVLLQGATPVVENVTDIVIRNGVETEITYPDTVAWTIRADKFEYR